MNFTNTTIIKMLKNIMYVGILRSGETKSEVFPELQIITSDIYARVQEIMKARTEKHYDVPFNSKGKALLSGMVYCAHCGSKLVLTTSSGKRFGGEGSRETRLRYGCHNKVRHPQDCDGQSGYSVDKLDALVEKLVMMIFRRIESIPESELVSQQYERQFSESTASLNQLKSLHAAKVKELESYKSEVYKVIQNISTWNMDLLNELITETKKQLDELTINIEKAQKHVEDCKRSSEQIRSEYSRVLSWADMYCGSSMDARKMILHQLICKVCVGRHYKIEIDFKISYEQFQHLGIDQDRQSA